MVVTLEALVYECRILVEPLRWKKYKDTIVALSSLSEFSPREFYLRNLLYFYSDRDRYNNIDQADDKPRWNIIDLTVGAPRQFRLKIGPEFGYHAHIIDERRGDTGWVGTIFNQDVYIEPHRMGKVKNNGDLSRVGNEALRLLEEDIRFALSKFPTESCRRPSLGSEKKEPKAIKL